MREHYRQSYDSIRWSSKNPLHGFQSHTHTTTLSDVSLEVKSGMFFIDPWQRFEPAAKRFPGLVGNGLIKERTSDAPCIHVHHWWLQIPSIKPIACTVQPRACMESVQDMRKPQIAVCAGTQSAQFQWHSECAIYSVKRTGIVTCHAVMSLQCSTCTSQFCIVCLCTCLS